MIEKDINDLFMWINEEDENILLSNSKDIKNLEVKGNRNTIVNLKDVNLGNGPIAIGYGAKCIMEKEEKEGTI